MCHRILLTPCFTVGNKHPDTIHPPSRTQQLEPLDWTIVYTAIMSIVCDPFSHRSVIFCRNLTMKAWFQQFPPNSKLCPEFIWANWWYLWTIPVTNLSSAAESQFHQISMFFHQPLLGCFPGPTRVARLHNNLLSFKDNHSAVERDWVEQSWE